MATKKADPKPEAKPKKPAKPGEWYVFPRTGFYGDSATDRRGSALCFARGVAGELGGNEDFPPRNDGTGGFGTQREALDSLRTASPGHYLVVKVTHRPVVEPPKRTSFIVRPNPTVKKGGE